MQPLVSLSAINYRACAQLITMFCPERGILFPHLDVDWTKDLWTTGYFAPIGTMGHIMTGISATRIVASALNSQE